MRRNPSLKPTRYGSSVRSRLNVPLHGGFGAEGGFDAPSRKVAKSPSAVLAAAAHLNGQLQ